MGPLVGKQVAVTRAAAQAREIGAILEDLGAAVLYLPLIEIVQIPAAITQLRMVLAAEPPHDWAVITSANGARCVQNAGGLNPTTKVAAIGPAVGHVLSRPVDLRPNISSASALIDEFPPGPGRVILVQGNLADTSVPEGLTAKGWTVDRVVAYTTVGRTPSSEEARRMSSCDAVTLYSPSAVHELASTRIALPRIIVTIGATTNDACRMLGWQSHQSASATNEAVAERLTELLTS